MTQVKSPKTPDNEVVSKIKVICRVRPFMKGEVPDSSVQIAEDKSLLVINQRCPTEKLKYTFDNCHSSTASQETIFTENVEPLLDDVFRGLDATIFCYGMTGAGKTHTIQGSVDNPGLIPRCMQAIFKQREIFLASGLENSNGRLHRFEVRISYMEIYLESVFDLLRPRDPKAKAGLAVREDANRNVFVSGLEKKLVNCFSEFEAEFSKGCKNRATAVTLLNQESSRSHAILGIELTIENSQTGKTYRSKLNMIDLAGSEDNRRTGNTSIRLNESNSINQSLHALGKVVDAINRRARQIPYRDSKMTRILQSTLGGKALGMMIVNIAPGKVFFPETLRALNFATKSKEIVNNVVANETNEISKVRDINAASLKENTTATRTFLPRFSSAQLPTPTLSSGRLAGRLARQSSIPVHYSANDTCIQSLAASLPLNAKIKSAEALVNKAKKLASSNQLDDAIRYYRQAMIFVPDLPTAKQALQSMHSKTLLLPSDHTFETPRHIKTYSSKERFNQNQSEVGLSSPNSPNKACSSTPDKTLYSDTPAIKRKLPHVLIPISATPIIYKKSNKDSHSPTETFTRSNSTSPPLENTKTDPPATPSVKSLKYNLRCKDLPHYGSNSDKNSDYEAILALSDPLHPLVALINMCKPNLLKSLWPAGIKRRQKVSDFVQLNGPIKTLKDLIPEVVSESTLLKALGKNL